jgi:hypothetical protein
MKKISRTLIVTFLVCCTLLASTGMAFAAGNTGTITVNCTSSSTLWVKSLFLPIANIYVYGPNGYYGHQWCGGSMELLPRIVQTRQYAFKNCPNGNYRVRVVWAGNIEQNQYFYTNWVFNDKTITFTASK